MKLSFYSNYLNHHQLPIAKELWLRLGDEYSFVATCPVSPSRIRFGYKDMDKEYPFVLTTYDSAEDTCRAISLAAESDAMIIGSAPDEYILERLKKGKITLRYSERYFKKKWTLINSIRNLLSAIKHIRRFQNQPLYYLCASAYTASDVNKFADYTGRFYKWGYFPEVKRCNIDELFAKKKENSHVAVLWCGRMIDWKHPEAAIEVASRLKSEGYSFDLSFIGDGPMRSALDQCIQEKQLVGHVHMLGAMPPEKVRAHMEAADIFLFTSDFNEGWGAVLNESMNSGCAVVASHAIGSVPFLMKHGENGFIYKNGDVDDLYKKTRELMDSEDLRYKFGRNAYHTMVDLWNAEVAAERLLQLIDELQKKGQCDLFEDGPCSRAEVLGSRWFNEGSSVV